MAGLGLKNTSSRLKRNEAKKAAEKKSIKPKEDVGKIVDSLHKEDKKSLIIRVSPELHKKLKMKSVLDTVSINEYVSNLIEDALVGDSRLDF